MQFRMLITDFHFFYILKFCVINKRGRKILAPNLKKKRIKFTITQLISWNMYSNGDNN